MKIAIIGTRGVPSKYGGFETFAEEVSTRFVKLGYKTVVYGRPEYYSESEKNSQYKGIRTVYLNSIKIKQFETILHSLKCTFHSIFIEKVDAVILCNVANSLNLPILKIFGKKVLINVDGLEWKRNKWSRTAKTVFKLFERIGAFFGKKNIVTDSMEISKYYKEKFDVTAKFIPYGGKILQSSDTIPVTDMEKRFGIKKDEYFLQITRFVPENNVYHILKNFIKSKTKKKFLLVGGDHYHGKYCSKIKQISKKDDRILLTGFIYDKKLIDTLLYNTFAYIHGNEVGGTNPALLQAMGGENIIFSIDTVFNKEVLKSTGIYFERSGYDLEKKINILEENPESSETLPGQAIKNLRINYNWDNIARRYLEGLGVSNVTALKKNHAKGKKIL